MEAVQVWQRPIIQYIEEPSISALRVKAEKQEESFITTVKLTEEEVLKNAKYVQTLFKPAARGQFCRESQAAVESCYKSHPNRTLDCRDKVLEFTACVAGAKC